MQKESLLSFKQIEARRIVLKTAEVSISGGRGIGRPKKNKEILIGRAGRNAIEREDIARESLRWQRRKQTLERFRGN